MATASRSSRRMAKYAAIMLVVVVIGIVLSKIKPSENRAVAFQHELAARAEEAGGEVYPFAKVAQEQTAQQGKDAEEKKS